MSAMLLQEQPVQASLSAELRTAPASPPPAQTAPKRFLQRHPLLAYCAVVFAISWCGLLLLAGPGAVPLDADHLVLLLGLGYVAMLAGPCLAGVLLTALRAGRPGLRALR